MIQIQKCAVAFAYLFTLPFYHFPVREIHFEAKRCRKCSKSMLTRSTNITAKSLFLDFDVIQNLFLYFFSLLVFPMDLFRGFLSNCTIDSGDGAINPKTLLILYWNPNALFSLYHLPPTSR